MSTTVGRWPNLLVIGAMKCGTTSLHSYLNEHPDVFMSEEKEIDFFSLHYDEGEAWYTKQFNSNAEICGESSQNYSKRHMRLYSAVPERIFASIPDVKIIYIVRDPIIRLVSNHVQCLALGDDHRSLTEIFSGKSKDEILNEYMVGTSRYYYQLQAYLEYFPLEQIHVVCFEELVKDRLTVMNSIFKFLNLEPIENDSIFDFVLNRGEEKSAPTQLASIIKDSKLVRKIKPLLSQQLIGGIKKNVLIQKILQKKVVKEELPENVADIVRDIFEDDVQKLRALTGKSFSDWSV